MSERWKIARKLRRNPFARTIFQDSSPEEREPFLARTRGELESFLDGFLAEIEGEPPLFEENPYVDEIETDPILMICQGMFSDEAEDGERPPPKRAMGWEEYRRRQAESRRSTERRRNLLIGVSLKSKNLVEELEALRDRLREALLVPKGDFPLLPALEQLISERNEARSERAENELEIAAALSPEKREALVPGKKVYLLCGRPDFGGGGSEPFIESGSLSWLEVEVVKEETFPDGTRGAIVKYPDGATTSVEDRFIFFRKTGLVRVSEDPPARVPEDRLAECARGNHRFALRQTTGKETCIDCYQEEGE